MAAPETKTPSSHRWIDLRNEFAIGAHTGASYMWLPSIGCMLATGMVASTILPAVKPYAIASFSSVMGVSAVMFAATKIGSKKETCEEHQYVYNAGRAVGVLAPLALAAYVGHITPPPAKPVILPEERREMAPASSTPQALQNKIKDIASQGGLKLTYL